MSTDAASQVQEVFSVQLSSGEVCTMTLDQLDEAFQGGRITESTAILPQDADAWTTLGDLAGIEGDGGRDAGDPGASDPMPAVRGSVAASEAIAAPAPLPVLAPTHFMGPPTPSAFSAMAHAPFALPPTDDLPSIRPMAADVGGDDFEAAAFRPNKRKLVVAGAVMLGVLLGVGLAITKLGGASDTPAPVAAAAGVVDSKLPPIVVAPPQAQPTPVAAAAPVAAPDTAGSPGSGPSTVGSRLTDEQKKTLLDADKGRTKKVRTNAAPHTTQKSKPVFHKGGNKFDPLNSSL